MLRLIVMEKKKGGVFKNVIISFWESFMSPWQQMFTMPGNCQLLEFMTLTSMSRLCPLPGLYDLRYCLSSPQSWLLK